MSTTWLSPHIDARYGKTSQEVLFTNLSYGTRSFVRKIRWKKLKEVAKGEAPAEDPWLQRAAAAFLIRSENSPPWPDFVIRLESELRRYLSKKTGAQLPEAKSKEDLLDLLGKAEECYRQHSMPKPYSGPHEQVGPLMLEPSRLVDFMFCHTRAFIEHDLEDSSRDLAFGLVEMFFDRPALKLRYEQQFCIPHTTQRRAELMIERMKPGSRVLVLGDDDLVSLALLQFSDDLQVDVLELDVDLVAFLKEKGGERLTVLEHNLRHGVPDSMKNCYDAVTTDPPYADDGMRFFLECAKVSMKDDPESRRSLHHLSRSAGISQEVLVRSRRSRTRHLTDAPPLQPIHLQQHLSSSASGGPALSRLAPSPHHRVVRLSVSLRPLFRMQEVRKTRDF